MKLLKLLLLALGIAQSYVVPLHNIEVAFNHKRNCLEIIKTLIDATQESIHMLAFFFTQPAIMTELLKAKERGVKIYIIADHYQEDCPYSLISACSNSGMEVFIDLAKRKGLAHNKVIIFDRKIVLTGSYNFTKSAQEKNEENILVLYDEKVAQAFYQYWLKLLQDARKFGAEKC